MDKPGRWKRWRARIGIAVLLAVLLLVRVDNFKLTPVEVIASDYLFSIATWEMKNLPRKWLHVLWELIPGNKPSREERLKLVDDYLQLARKVQKEENRIEGLLIGRNAAQASGAAAKAAVPSRERLDELIDQRQDIQAEAEEAVEAELSALLAEMGFASRFGLIFPPVDIRFEGPPTLLVLSPRDRISLTGSVLLEADIKGVDRDKIERKVFEEQNLAALVDDLAGLATYPSIVSDLYTTRTVMRTVTHEWLHSYFFFRPLGQNYRASDTMFTINETTADIVGREVGDNLFERMGGDLTVSASRYAPAEDRDPNFTRVMRETRQRVDELLSEGLVEEAEQYMREQQWFLRLRGYGLRKLNQAYFAFRGRYAESPASVSPIGDQLKELRSLMPSVGEFIRQMANVASDEEFLALLKRARAGEI